jgi:hypothetical protein
MSPSCGAPLSVLVESLGVLHCPRGHHWPRDYADPPKVCAFGDPTCPCQDGDLCHYVADEDTPAMTPPLKGSA